mgnify:CR=1 FL=1
MIPTTHSRKTQHTRSQRRGKGARVLATITAFIGYLLSPLSWWNDLFINMPLAYLFAVPFSLLDEQFYLPSFVLGYWLSNVLGLLLLQRGGTQLIKQRQAHFSWKGLMISASLYTLLIVLLVQSGIVPSASELAQRFQPAE